MNTANILALNIPLIFIMFGLGCTLKIKDFKNLFIAPKSIIIGLLSQLVIIPLIAIFIIIFFKLPNEITFGVLLVTFCPGGPVSNLVSNLCNGDVALSVALTSISSILCIITTPLWISASKAILVNANIPQVNLLSISITLLFVVVTPIYMGMIVNNKYPFFSKKIQKYVKIASTIILLSAIIILVVTKKRELFDLFKEAGLIVAIIHFATLGFGFLVARFFRLSLKHQLTISIESGYQNNTLAIVLATTIFNSISMSIPGILYGLIKSISALILYMISKKLLKLG